MAENILDMVQRVAGLRSQVAAAKKQRLELLATWEKEYAPLLDAEAQTTQELAGAENTLRAEAIKIYQETGSKTPGPGVGIREITEIRYDPEVALDWATKHNIALQLNAKAFEKIAKASPFDFVEMAKIHQATISQDLEAALKEANG